MTTLDYIFNKFHISSDDQTNLPIAIPNVGRNNLAQWLHELDFKTGVEVGVAAGEYSQILCQANPQMQLYGVDPWKPYRGYRDYTRPQTFTRFYDQAATKLNQYPNYTFIPKFSLEAVTDFPDRSLDFVYIDANHNFQNVTNDIVEWSKKVKIGGIISGHDYYKHRHHEHIHVYQVVNAYTDSYRIRPWFVLGGDHPRSWMWVCLK